MSQTFDPENLKNLPPEIVARLKANRAQTEAKTAQQKADLFIPWDSVSGARNPDGTIIPQEPFDLQFRITKGTHLSALLFSIYKFQDSHGNIVYFITTEEEKGNQSHIKALSETIKAQQAGFQRLDPQEQTRLRAGTDPLGNVGSKCGTYLKNEALGELFKKLK